MPAVGADGSAGGAPVGVGAGSAALVDVVGGGKREKSVKRRPNRRAR